MWLTFALSCCFGLLILYAPGFVILRLMRFTNGFAFCAAPLLSSCMYSMLGIVFDELGVAANPVTVLVVPLAALTIALYIQDAGRELGTCPSAGTIALCAAVGLLAGWYIFVGQMIDGPFAYTPNYDQIHHLNSVQVFAESETFSFLHNSLYTPAELAAGVPVSDSGFYPSGWHVLCALLVQLLGVQTSFAINVMNYLFSSFVFPLSTLCLLGTCFPQSRRIQLFGGIASVSFAAFPWLLLVWGPLFPNMASYAVVPIECALLLRAFALGESARASLRCFAAAAAGLLGVSLIHPNGAFVVAVMIGSYLVQAAFSGDLQKRTGVSTGNCVFDGAILIAVFGLLWIAVYRLPFLSGIVSYVWEEYQTPLEAVANYISLAQTRGFFGPESPQWALAVLLIACAVYAISKRELRWLVQAYIFWGVAFVLTTSHESGLSHLIAGFWYSDPMRLVAASVLCAAPMAACGFDGLCNAIGKAVAGSRRQEPKAYPKYLEGSLAALIVLLCFIPPVSLGDFAYESAISQVQHFTRVHYWADFSRLDSSERRFLYEVAEIIPDGAIVANNPCDGSFFAYGACDVHVLYRHFANYIDDDGSDERSPETQDSILIRTSLDEYLENEEVRRAVEETGVEYVLQLVSPEGRPDSLGGLVGDGSEEWAGIVSIDEDTPGFTLVLEEGDYRLFKVDEAA